jgi:hypothetical protein
MVGVCCRSAVAVNIDATCGPCSGGGFPYARRDFSLAPPNGQPARAGDRGPYVLRSSIRAGQIDGDWLDFHVEAPATGTFPGECKRMLQSDVHRRRIGNGVVAATDRRPRRITCRLDGDRDGSATEIR